MEEVDLSKRRFVQEEEKRTRRRSLDTKNYLRTKSCIWRNYITEEIIEQGLRIQESGIIKKLLPDLKSEVVDVGIIQKMTSNGQSTRFKAIVAAGNENGYLGIGQGKSKQMRIAIEKATSQAYLNINPIKMGCGSWECKCDQKHSVPFKVKGKGGSVTIEIIPAPRGLGLVAGGKIKRLLELAGLKDAWTTAKGSTPTMNSTSKAVSWTVLDRHSVRVDENGKCSTSC